MTRRPRLALLAALPGLFCLAGCLELQGSSPPAPSAATGGSGPSAPLGPLDGGLRVMTWNVENFSLADDTPARVAAIVEEHAPDVVAIQEIREASAFGELDALLPDYRGVIDDDPGNYLRQGVIYRTDRVTIGVPTSLFASDGWAFPRAALSVPVAVPGFDFVLISVHLKAQVDPESQARRAAAIEKLHGWLDARLAEDGEHDFVVVGDFNDQLTDPPEWNVFTPLLADERFRFLTFEHEVAGDFTYIPFEVMLDHALVSETAAVAYGEGQTQIFALDGLVAGYRDISDHRPVVVDFAL